MVLLVLSCSIRKQLYVRFICIQIYTSLNHYIIKPVSNVTDPTN